MQLDNLNTNQPANGLNTLKKSIECPHFVHFNAGKSICWIGSSFRLILMNENH